MEKKSFLTVEKAIEMLIGKPTLNAAETQLLKKCRAVFDKGILIGGTVASGLAVAADIFLFDSAICGPAVAALPFFGGALAGGKYALSRPAPALETEQKTI